MALPPQKLRQRIREPSHFPIAVRDVLLRQERDFCGSASAAAAYNRSMARGWESKSVEAQIEESDSETSTNQQALSADELHTALRRNDLLLSRKRVLQQLEASTNERYSELLRRTLAGLDLQLGELN